MRVCGLLQQECWWVPYFVVFFSCSENVLPHQKTLHCGRAWLTEPRQWQAFCCLLPDSGRVAARCLFAHWFIHSTNSYCVSALCQALCCAGLQEWLRCDPCPQGVCRVHRLVGKTDVQIDHWDTGWWVLKAGGMEAWDRAKGTPVPKLDLKDEEQHAGQRSRGEMSWEPLESLASFHS